MVMPALEAANVSAGSVAGLVENAKGGQAAPLRIQTLFKVPLGST
jgi:hypothetical protein